MGNITAVLLDRKLAPAHRMWQFFLLLHSRTFSHIQLKLIENEALLKRQEFQAQCPKLNMEGWALGCYYFVLQVHVLHCWFPVWCCWELLNAWSSCTRTKLWRHPPGIWLVLVYQNELALTRAGCCKTWLPLIFGLFWVWPFSFYFSTMLWKKQAGLCQDSGAMALSLQIYELSKLLFFTKLSTTNNWL